MAIKIVQNAYVTPSLPDKCLQIHRDFGIGPFVLAENLELGSHLYRGALSDPLHLDLAFAQSGELNIEIIQVKSSGPSAFSDMFEANEGGLHHIAYFCDNYETDRDRLTQMGYPVASEFSLNSDTRIAYVDTRSSMGHMLELYTRNTSLLKLYDQVRNAANDWDGRDLFQPWIL